MQRELVLEVLIPYKLSLNKYHTLHYYKLNQIKHHFYDEVRVAKRTGLMPKPPYDTHYHFILHGSQMDTTNLVGMVKPIEDGLWKNGLIEDDTHTIVKGVSITQEHAPSADDKINRCILTIKHYGE